MYHNKNKETSPQDLDISTKTRKVRKLGASPPIFRLSFTPGKVRTCVSPRIILGARILMGIFCGRAEKPTTSLLLLQSTHKSLFKTSFPPTIYISWGGNILYRGQKTSRVSRQIPRKEGEIVYKVTHFSYFPLRLLTGLVPLHLCIEVFPFLYYPTKIDSGPTTGLQ